jgi:uncharacterized protein YukJ
MAVPNYSILKGDPQPGTVSGKNPHFRIPVNTISGMFTIDVNVESTDGSEVLYVVIENFTPPDAEALGALSTGVTGLEREPGGLALDYVRETVNGAPLVAPSQMSLLPIGRGTMKNQVATILNQAIKDDNGVIYAFGSSFADANGQQGIHDIHMNQGNPKGRFQKDNAIWQDGGIFFELPASSKWMAVFLAFQTESWTTDDNGNPMKTAIAQRSQ